MNKIIAYEEDINNEIFINYFNYQNPLRLVKDLSSTKQDKNEKIVSNNNDRLIDLRNGINRKIIPENENPKKGVDIGKGIKVLALK